MAPVLVPDGARIVPGLSPHTAFFAREFWKGGLLRLLPPASSGRVLSWGFCRPCVLEEQAKFSSMGCVGPPTAFVADLLSYLKLGAGHGVLHGCPVCRGQELGRIYPETIF
jgi:hypothetical protein